jgi:TATA-binding protein-associated factor
VRALSQLANVLCGSGDVAAAEAAKTLEAQVIRLMAAPKATWRMTGAHLLTQWLDAIPEGAAKPPLEAPGARLGELLSNTNPSYPSLPSAAPYAEVKGFQERVKTEAMGLLRAAGQGGVQLTSSEVPSPAAEGFGAEHAGTLAAAVPQVRARTHFSPNLDFRFWFSPTRSFVNPEGLA